ncbi:hypothetical protein GCM10020295_03410 [Streptomyces cinereospinus]
MVNTLTTATAERAAPGTRPAGSAAGGHARSRRRQAVVAYLFLAPALLFFAVFLILPLGFAVLLSTSRWAGFDLGDIRPVGTDNFAGLFADGSTFLTPILTNTLLFALGTVVLALAGSVLVATCIDNLRFQGLWRTLYFPAGRDDRRRRRQRVEVHVRAGWPRQRRPQRPRPRLGGLPPGPGHRAACGRGRPGLGLARRRDPRPDRRTEVHPRVVPRGRGARRRRAATVFWKITLPLLRPSLLLVCVTELISGLQSFALIIVMTKGGPGDATNVAALEMYRQAFSYGHWGPASAAAFVLFAVVLVVTLAQLWIYRRKGEDA